MIYLAVLGVAIWAVAIFMTLYGPWLAHRHSRSKLPLAQDFHFYQPVSILKPLKGVDEELSDNLESFFHLDYPKFELLFSISDINDPACSIVKKLMNLYPAVNSKLILGGVNQGSNPKVNNLIVSYERAEFDWLVISDSNVRVGRNYLKNIVEKFDSTIGIVTSVVSGVNPNRIGGQLEAMHLNTYISRGMHLAAQFDRPCAFGKSMLFRRSVADRFGGIRALADYLAEDYMAGEAMARLGLRVQLATDPVFQYIGSHSFQGFWSRQIRWGRIRKAQIPFVFLAELILNSGVSGLIGGLSFLYLFKINYFLFILFHFIIWLVADLFMLNYLGVDVNFISCLFWMFGEALRLPLWLCIASGNTVKWRGQTLKLLAGGLVELKKQNSELGYQQAQNVG